MPLPITQSAKDGLNALEDNHEDTKHIKGKK